MKKGIYKRKKEFLVNAQKVNVEKNIVNVLL